MKDKLPKELEEALDTINEVTEKCMDTITNEAPDHPYIWYAICSRLFHSLKIALELDMSVPKEDLDKLEEIIEELLKLDNEEDGFTGGPFVVAPKDERVQ